jgi:SIR2-like domain
MIDKFPEEILKAIIGRRLVPFIGAGFSWFFYYPSWGELLKGVAKDLKLNIQEKDLSGKDPLQVAESFFCHYKGLYYEKVKEEILGKLPEIEKIQEGDKIFKNLIETKLETDFSRLVVENLIALRNNNVQEGDREENKNKLSRLKELPFKNIVTTNYDKNLEELFPDFAVLSPGRADEFGWDEAGNTIFKIHGDVDVPEGIIFTQSQYYRFMNELGFYRSRLYTIFSSSVVLMLGYGFGDINIHNIYFQFRRDYKDHLANADRRAYIVLVDYDRKKLGTYYDSYKGFLKAHGIEVLDNFDTLPDFVEGLAEAVQQFRERSDLQTLFENNVQWDTTQSIVMDLVKRNTEPSIDNIVNNDATVKNVLIALDKIVSYPEVLIQKPFFMEIHSGILSQDVGLRILRFVNRIIEAREEIGQWNEYTRIVLASLKFVNQTRDFNWHPPRVSIFLKLATKIKDINGIQRLEGEFGYEMKNLFYFSNRSFGSCWRSGDLVESQLTNIPTALIEAYLKYRIKTISSHQRFLPPEEKTWKNKFRETFDEENYPEIVHLIDELEEKIEKAKEGFLTDDDE